MEYNKVITNIKISDFDDFHKQVQSYNSLGNNRYLIVYYSGEMDFYKLIDKTLIREKNKFEIREKDISLNELCRQKLRDNDKLSKIEYALEQIQIILNKSLGGKNGR